MLILHPLHPSGPDFLLVCGCKSTTFPDTIPQNNLIQNKPKLQYAHKYIKYCPQELKILCYHTLFRHVSILLLSILL